MTRLPAPFLFAAALAAVPATALATPFVGNCAITDAPFPYSASTCHSSHCTVSPTGDELDCQSYALGGGAAGTSAWVVSDYDGTGDNEYSAWGVDDSSLLWCCHVDDTLDDLDAVRLFGSGQSDYLAGTFGSLNVEDVDEFEIQADDGVDTCVASNAVSSLLRGEDGADLLLGGDKADDLFGGRGGDEIYGGARADYIEGNGGGDEIYGDGGADEIHGGVGHDTLEGGSGHDEIHGDNGDDTLRGRDGNDTLYGGHGADVLCGGGTAGTGSDALYAAESGLIELPNDPDILWSPTSANAPTGSGTLSGDSCGHATAHASGWAGSACSYTLTVRPTECI